MAGANDKPARPNHDAAIAEYVQKITAATPAEAVKIAMAEVDRSKLLAQQAAHEYRMLSEVEFDNTGRIVKANLAGLWRLAQVYAASQIVPEQYRGRPEDCFVACQMALRLRIDAFAYMQSSYVVYGKPSVEAKLAIAMLNTSGKIKGRIRYREDRTDKKVMTACTAFAIDAETSDEVSATVTWDMAVAEGWVGKSGSKWKTIPDLMFHYRSASFLIKQFYPEVLLGMDFEDELEDRQTVRVVGNAPQSIGELGDQIRNGFPGESHHEAPAPQNGDAGSAKIDDKPDDKADKKEPKVKKGRKQEQPESEQGEDKEPAPMSAWSEGSDEDPKR